MRCYYSFFGFGDAGDPSTVLDLETYRALQAAAQAQAAKVSAATTSVFQPVKITGTLSPQDQDTLDRLRAATPSTPGGMSKLLPIAAGALLAAVLLR